MEIDARKDNFKGDIEICGYPEYEDTPEMWTATGKIKSASENFLKYEIPARQGQSGSPIMKSTKGGKFVVGIHMGVNT